MSVDHHQNSWSGVVKSGKMSGQRKDGLDNEYRGRYLKIQPGDALIFQNNSTKRDCVDFIQLTNLTSGNVTFKVKTTAPEKFRIKPSFGCIEPGATKSVEVSINPGFLLTAQRDKFLIMSAALQSLPSTHTELVDLWQTLGKDEVTNEVDEHRLRCSVVPASSEVLSQEQFADQNPSTISHEFASRLDALNAKVDRLIELQNQASRTNYLERHANVLPLAGLLLILYLAVQLIQHMYS